MEQAPPIANNTFTSASKPFSYDAQLVRLLLTFGVKCIGGFSVVSGTQYDGKIRFQPVNVLYGGLSRMVQYLLGNGSDNIITALPVMSYVMSGMKRNGRMQQNPQVIQDQVVRLRARDPDGNLLVNQPGEIVTIKRAMPVPYTITLDVAIWASNNDQMFQLIEQICTKWPPDQEINLSNSPLDWASITTVRHTGDVNFEEVTPSKESDTRMVARMSFEAATWLSLPVSVSETAFIHEVQTNLRLLEDYGYSMFGDNVEIPTMPLIDQVTILATPQEINTTGGQ